ncbi:rod shape-determining protein MreC [Wenyingzhuangia sp. 1_MG-2023]|nr:rod shape-determining protein MreC [Wenyingzhuangia sp. 1_MG-2023]
MQFIIYIIQKNKHVFLFCLFELIALFFTIQLHSYQKSKFINSANSLTGGIYNNAITLSSFFNLRVENKLLIQENERLHNLIETRNITTPVDSSVTQKTEQGYRYISASIINNDYHQNNNFITLDKGENDGVQADMAIINSQGIVGIITKNSQNYSVAISVLNKYFKTNAKFKNTPYFGTISWNGKNTNIVQLLDIPRQAHVKVGDTIVTGGRSAIFPEGILIGSVHKVGYNNNRHQNIDVKLFNDLRTVNNVYVIENLHKSEIKNLEKTTYE